MATLLLLNGPPGIGKSTLARRYVADRPLAVCVDVDTLRGHVGQWKRYSQESGLLARRMAVAMARVALQGGHDVVVPQYLGRTAFIEELAALASEVNVTFWEVLLMDSKDSAVARFFARRDDPQAAEHQRDAEDQVGGVAGVAALYDQLADVLQQRPRTRVVASRSGELDDTYRHLLAALTAP